MAHLEEKTISSEQKFDGRIVKLYVDKAELEDGKVVTREVIRSQLWIVQPICLFANSVPILTLPFRIQNNCGFRNFCDFRPPQLYYLHSFSLYSAGKIYIQTSFRTSSSVSQT